MSQPISRRQMMVAGSSAAGLAALTNRAVDAASAAALRQCKFSLNTGTLRGMKLPLDRLIEIAAAAGYDAIEPWIDEIRRYEESGGSLRDVKKRLADHGLDVVDAIGFARWIVDDDQKRSEGLEQVRRDMELVQRIGGHRIAAPPAGATAQTVPLPIVAERYAKLLEIGAAQGVQPQLELWGSSKTLNRIGELAYVAAECGRDDAGLLPDVFHIYKGGSDFTGLAYVNGAKIHVFHMNDYPRTPPRDQARDSDRVFPGAGVAPLKQILDTLFDGGFCGALSVEVFNRSYWQQEPLQVAKQGLASMRHAVAG